MSMTIGRVAINEDPYDDTFRVAGNVVSFASDLNASSVDDVQAKIAQLAGLVDNTEESVVPFTWTEDPKLDGFYRVRDIRLSPGALYLTTGTCPFSVELERVGGGFARPQFEFLVQHVLMTNEHGVVSPLSAVRAAYYAQSLYSHEVSGYMASANTLALTTEDGTVNSRWGSVSFPATKLSQLYVKPADYYKGGARLEVKFGSTWYPMHGRQLPLGVGGNWRISNGFCRVYPSITSGTGRFTVETYRSGSWYGREFWIGIYDNVGGSWTAQEITSKSTTFTDPVVVRNARDLVVVRMPVYLYGSDEPQYVDFSLRNGDSWIEVTEAGMLSGAALMLAAGLSSAVTTTSFTGGVRATSNDANGLRYLIAAPFATTADTANARVRLTNDTYTSATLCITADYQVSSISNTTTDTGLRDAFLGSRAQTEIVIAR